MKITRPSLFVLFCLLTFCNYAQIVQWVNSNSGRNFSTNSNTSVTVDLAGNAYVTGSFSDTMSIGTNTIVSKGFDDVFISKTNAAGTTKWLKSMGGVNSDMAFGICSDKISDLIIAGSFEGVAVFNTYTLSASVPNFFLCKMDSSGNTVWARKYGGPGSGTISAVCSDPSSNIYLTGTFTGTCIIGNYTLTAPGFPFSYPDAFVAKLDNNGNVLWCLKFGGNASDSGNSISTDNAGNVYAIGSMQSSGAFGPYLLNSNGGFDAYIVKINTNGNVLWAKNFGGTNDDIGTSLVAFKNSAVYLGGTYTPPFSIGTNTFTMLGSFISNIDTSGAVIWANKFETTGFSNGVRINGITSDVAGNIYSAGWFTGTVAFGTNSLVAAVLTEPTGFAYDGFISKLDASGNFGWVKQVANPGFGFANRSCTSITYNPGNLFVSGVSSGTATIDSYTFNSTYNQNGFLIKIGLLDVGIQEIFKENKILVYPNPAHSVLNFSFDKEFEGELEIRLKNVLGEELMVKKNKYSENETIDISELPAGIYFIEFETKQYRTVKKIIRE